MSLRPTLTHDRPKGTFSVGIVGLKKTEGLFKIAHLSESSTGPRLGTLEFAKYVIVFTTSSSGSTVGVLRSYRMRWQIELVFKRLKTLAQGEVRFDSLLDLVKRETEFT
jgi:Transposase DDE domain